MKKLLTIFIILIGFSTNLYAAGGGSGGSGGSGEGSGGSGEGSGGGRYSYAKSDYDQTLSAIWSEIKNENYQSALESLQTYVYENPEDADGWNLIGFTSRKLRIFNDAEKYYQNGLEIDPEHEGILQYQGELYLETNRIDLAKANLEKLNDLCIFNCKEKKELAKLISNYEE